VRVAISLVVLLLITAAPSASAGCGTYNGRVCAPASARVDLRKPSFSHSTRITNPLFPISRLRSAVLLGHVEGKPFRTETTLLPGTQTVAWGGRYVRVRVSQYVAYLDGHLDEVALDRYAQADDGSVWYFGEDVFDYKHGAVTSTEGTWLAGREGPPAMIMPAKPKRGNVYRTENAAPIVFEEVRIKRVGVTVAGPLGPVRGAIVADELHSDGTHEDKIFAPGYGEFRTAGGGDLEALALAVPTDGLREPSPSELTVLATSAAGIFDSTAAEDWAASRATLKHMRQAWASLSARRMPRLVAARMSIALAKLASAVDEKRPPRAGQAAIDVLQSTLDLRLPYRPAAEVDRERFVLWTRQLQLDARAHDVSSVTGDVATLEWIRDRITRTLDDAGRRDIDTRLRDLRSAADAGNVQAAADHAARLGARLRILTGPRHGR
jgi:hypothetical protein